MATAKKKVSLEPQDDPTDRVPSVPEGKTKRIQVTSVREWYDGWHLHREGVSYVGEFLLDSKGKPKFPSSKVSGPLVVPSEDYEPPKVNLPGTTLDGRRGSIRGGASGMPSL